MYSQSISLPIENPKKAGNGDFDEFFDEVRPFLGFCYVPYAFLMNPQMASSTKDEVMSEQSDSEPSSSEHTSIEESTSEKHDSEPSTPGQNAFEQNVPEAIVAFMD
ncbi:unnamed protein product [Vicia faba]|uniref:Uncharacterized protein n=1 Tax=Vicia faba TaxID=3906 RepID=A0AAV0ZIP7_VICFA|nr:unnamed protein product [Vicia faba]